MVKARRIVVVSIAAMMVLVVVVAQAANTGTLIVKTQDKGGGAYPGILVEVKNSRKLPVPAPKMSDAAGTATFMLSAGAGYVVRVSGGGMTEQTSEEFKIEHDKIRTVIFTLSPGVVEKVIVSQKLVDGSAHRTAFSSTVASAFGGFAPVRQEGARAFHGRTGKDGPEWNTEQYARIVDNPFLAVAQNPLSTFSVDVDRASYSNVRRFLNEGRLPPKDAVRIEELVNYFAYDYPEPGVRDPFSVTTEVSEAPWNPRHWIARIGLKARSVDLKDIPAGNLVFLIDVSGSMAPADKLPLLKSSFAMLVDQLRPQDRVAIVVYAGSAGLVLPSTPGSKRGKILDALEALEAGGSTAGGEGIRLAYKIAAENHIDGGNNRVILATDGDFNVGVSSDAEMVRLIEEKRRQGTFLTVLGFGTGNLQDAKMEQIADKGNGHYAYIDCLLEARKVLVGELGGTLLTVAKDVKLQVEFNPARVAAYRLIGYENRLMRDEDFNDDTKDAGDVGAGHTVTALYELVPVGVEGDVKLGTVDPLRYAAGGKETGATGNDELLFVKLRYKEPDGETSRLLEHPVAGAARAPSEDLRFAAAVAAFGMLLRDSEHKGSSSFDDVMAAAGRAGGKDASGSRTEFVRLAARARELSAQKVAANTTD